MTEKALVLFSGGQDSTVCLAWALERFDAVETIGFDYRQRHRIELECRGKIRQEICSAFPDWTGRLGCDHVLDLAILSQISETALTRDTEIAFNQSGLPSTFVPGRNLLFFTFAAAIAYRRGIKHLIGGMCETDFSGYPDCRDDTLKALQVALNLGMDRRFVVHTPLMWIDKAGTWALAEKIGGGTLITLVVNHTVTEVRGFGRQKGHREIYRGAEYEIAYVPKVKLEVAVPADLAERVVETIRDSARTGNIGDGKIFVLTLELAMRVRTGETGASAL